MKLFCTACCTDPVSTWLIVGKCATACVLHLTHLKLDSAQEPSKVMHVERRTVVKFKTYKAARNYLVTRIEAVGVDVRDVNVDCLMINLFKCKGAGDNFELELHARQDTFSAILRALRIPRRGTVSDEHWTMAVRRMGTYMGMTYAAEDADGLARELADQALFARHMAEEAL